MSARSTSRRARRILCAVVCGCAAFSSLRAESVANVAMVPDADADVHFATPGAQIPHFGFAPVRVWIANRANRERSWAISFHAGWRTQFPGELTSGLSMSVPAGQTGETWVMVPVAEPGMNITVSGGPAASPPVVRIDNIPNGKKVFITTTLSSGDVMEREDEYDTVAGTIKTSTFSTASGSRSSHTRPMAPSAGTGTVVTLTINPTTGNSSPRIQRNGVKGAPTVYKLDVGVVSTKPRRTPPPTSYGTATPMNLTAEVVGPAVSYPQVGFPNAPSSNTMRPFAVSPAMESTLRAQLSSLMAGAPNLSAVDFTQIPADWRAWSSFSGVILTTNEYALLDGARRSALRQWVALGGQLCVAPLSSETVEPDHVERIGAGFIVTMGAPIASYREWGGGDDDDAPENRDARLQEEVTARRAARGGAAASATGLKGLKLFEGTPGLPDRSALEVKLGPLVEAAQEDVASGAWLAIFLVVFGTVIGPINLFLLAPAKRRYRLFITTPLISLVAALVLGGTILVQDGTGGTGLRQTFVTLIPGENAAAVIQEQSSRTGLLVGRSFALPDDIAMAMLPFENSPPYGLDMTLERSEGSGSGDWFQSRTRQAQQLRRIVPTRARVEQVGVGPAGAPVVQSSLGTTLKNFSYVDAKGGRWKVAELPPGQRVTLQVGDSAWAADTLMSSGTSNFNHFTSTAGADAAGRWSAIGGATEIAPIPTLKSVRWHDADIVYVGVLENSGAAAPAGSQGGAR